MSNAFDIEGLVFPIPMPFDESGGLCEKTLENYCHFLVDQHAQTLLVTVGTSRFNLLTQQEMKTANQIVASSVRSKCVKAKAIVSGPGPNTGSTAENIEFAKFAGDIGADAIIIVYPERWYGDDDVVRFFEEVAEASPIPVMIHAVPMRDGFGGIHATQSTSVEILKRLAEHPRIVGVKEENGDRAMFEKILKTLSDKLAIIGAGGAMRRYQKDYPLGTKNYLVGIESFVPEYGHAFFEAMQKSEYDLADSIASKHEDPFFQKAVEYGWHRSLKTGLSLMGLMPPYERAPFPVLSSTQISSLREVMVQSGWSIK